MKRWQAIARIAELLIKGKHPVYALIVVMTAILVPFVASILMMIILR